MSRLRTALFFQDGNFVGREYFFRLARAGRPPDLLVAVGRMTPQSIEVEKARTAGKWNPPALPADMPLHRFEALSEPAIVTLLAKERIDVALQGGVGLLRQPLISAPEFGFLNCHPGRLPDYRGSSCPEWAIANGDPVVATAHVVDEGLDTGPVISQRKMPIGSGWDYHDFRANLYGHCAAVLAEALNRIEATDRADWAGLAVPQDAPQDCRPWPRMPEEKLADVKRCFADWAHGRSGEVQRSSQSIE